MTERVTNIRDIQTVPFPEASQNGHTAEPHTWKPANLIQLAANPPAPPTIGGLLYPGKRTVLSGETESMKTWLALILCKAELDIGHPVGWVDLDAMGPGALLERLQLLGVTDTQIDDFLYYEPSQSLGPTMLQEIEQAIKERGIRLFVIDAFNPILFLQGLDPNANPDIEQFWQTIADPICRAGAAPVLLDHVVKNADNRGKYSTGSERKASGAIVHIGFKLLEPLTKGGRGRTLLNVHKDRPGYLQRPTLGRLVLTSTDNQISYELEPDKSHDTDGGFRPTILMQRVSEYLEAQPDAVSQNQIENGAEGNRDAKRKALDILVAEGYASRTDGANRAKLFTAIRPYREATDTPDTGSPPVRPGFAPTLRSTPSSVFAHFDPLRGEGANQRETQTPSAPEVRPDPEIIHEYDHPPIDENLAYQAPEEPAGRWWDN